MKLLILGFFLFIQTITVAQPDFSNSDIKWMTIEEALANNPENKNLFLFIYEDSCEYCEKTIENTFADKKYAATINKYFQPVLLNALSFETITVKDMNFEFDEGNGFHSLPIVLLEGKLSFPSFVFMNQNFEMISKYSGYQPDTALMIKHLKYIGSNSHETMTWNEYNTSN